MGHTPGNAEFVPLDIAVLTVSDTRVEIDDKSGKILVDQLCASGHRLYSKAIVKDDIYQVRAIASEWIADSNIKVILITGGTGFSERDSTPEAITPLFDKQINGFGELFRQLSFDEIGTSTIQSRSLAGIANNTVIFCMPGSPGACTTAWKQVIREQLDLQHRPCNFVAMLSQKILVPRAVVSVQGGK